jgi:hypothetical protein
MQPVSEKLLAAPVGAASAANYFLRSYSPVAYSRLKPLLHLLFYEMRKIGIKPAKPRRDTLPHRPA